MNLIEPKWGNSECVGNQKVKVDKGCRQMSTENTVSQEIFGIFGPMELRKYLYEVSMKNHLFLPCLSFPIAFNKE